MPSYILTSLPLLICALPENGGKRGGNILLCEKVECSTICRGSYDLKVAYTRMRFQYITLSQSLSLLWHISPPLSFSVSICPPSVIYCILVYTQFTQKWRQILRGKQSIKRIIKYGLTFRVLWCDIWIFSTLECVSLFLKALHISFRYLYLKKVCKNAKLIADIIKES